MTKAGIKTEDYREITPYWCNRLMLHEEKQQSKHTWWVYIRELKLWRLKECIETDNKFFNFSVKQFDDNIMTIGYPKPTDTERILRLEHKGIEIITGNPEWGAEPGKLYFVIKHGKELKE